MALLRASSTAPAAISNSAHVVDPVRAAQCSGVIAYGSAAFTIPESSAISSRNRAVSSRALAEHTS